jgi:hypothetical protein
MPGLKNARTDRPPRPFSPALTAGVKNRMMVPFSGQQGKTARADRCGPDCTEENRGVSDVGDDLGSSLAASCTETCAASLSTCTVFSATDAQDANETEGR